MIDIQLITYPSNKPVLRPNELVIDAGYSDDNFNALIALSKKLDKTKWKQTSYSADFYGFFQLYDNVIKQLPNARDYLPDFGYSPYNLMLLIKSLNLHKKEFSKLVGCSFSKILANTAYRKNSYFKPLVGNQWKDLLNCYLAILEESDKHHSLEHDKDFLFLMRANQGLPLQLPATDSIY